MLVELALLPVATTGTLVDGRKKKLKKNEERARILVPTYTFEVYKTKRIGEC